MLTVLLATRNGARTLRPMLEACCELDAPRGDWKLVIVDNASTDDTKSVVADFDARLDVTYLFEPAPGKNSALNTGLAAVAGDLVVLTDDDIVPAKDWLVRLRGAADAHPDFAIFGGTVVGLWEVPPPDWILNWVPLGPVFTISDATRPAGPVSPGMVFGPNMAIRAEVFRAGHRFDTTIGPSAGQYAMGSETEFAHRLAAGGYRAWHVHDAVVQHFIRASQMDRRWILNRAVRFGRGQYRLKMRNAAAPPHRWFGVPRYLFRELAGAAVSVTRSTISGNADARFRAQWLYHDRLGAIIEARRMHLESEHR